MCNAFSHSYPNFAEKNKRKMMNINKVQLNDKTDKEAAKHAIKTRYLNSYKVIVAGGRDCDNFKLKYRPIKVANRSLK